MGELEKAVGDLQLGAAEAKSAQEELVQRVDTYRADQVAGERDHLRIRFTGDQLFQLLQQSGKEAVRQLLLTWYDGYRQGKAQDGEGNKRTAIESGHVYDMPRVRGQQGGNRWVILEVDTPAVRRHLCHALFHSPTRTSDRQWASTRPQASLTQYQREARNFVFLSFAEDPRVPALGPSSCKGNIPWPTGGPKWNTGRLVVLYADQACIKTAGCNNVLVPLSSPQRQIMDLVSSAKNLQPAVGGGTQGGALPGPPPRTTGGGQWSGGH